MLAKLRSCLTYANVMATVAVFVALGGTSYAVATGSIDSREIKNNSVTSADLRNNNVRGKDVRQGTLRSGDVADGSLLREDFKAGQLPAGQKGDTGATGSKGDKGDQGPAGPTQGSATTQTVPSSTPEVVNLTHNITTTTGGSLYVFGRGELETGCTAGGPTTGLYVDGTPVPASGTIYATATPTRVSIFGVSDPVPAGNHTVTMRTDCVGGNFTFANTNDSALGAILLGGS